MPQPLSPNHNISNWLSGLPEVQITTAVPTNAYNPSVQQMTEKKADLGQKLARRKSQDFASKIQGWNETGAGVLPKQNVAVDVADKQKKRKEPKRQKDKSRDGGEGEGEPHEDEEAEAGEGKDEGEKEADKDEDVVEVILEAASTENTEPPEPANKSSGLQPVIQVVTPDRPIISVVKPDVATKQAASAQKIGRDINLRRGAWVRRKSKTQVELLTDVKHAGAPKKRIISDGHWRRDRLPPKEEKEVVTPEQPSTSKPVTVRRSVVNVGLRVPPSSFTFTEPGSEPVKIKSLRHVRSHSPPRTGSDNEREASPDFQSDGTKIYIKRRRRSGQHNPQNPRTSGSSLTAPSSAERPSSETDITPPSPLAIRKIPSNTHSEPRRQLHKALSGEDTLHENATRRRPSQRKRSKTAELPLKIPASQPRAGLPPRIYGNRIEGWLADTMDPFTEGKDRSLAPEPLHISKIKSRRSAESGEDAKFRDETRGSNYNRRRSLRNRPSQLEVESQDSTNTSADGLSDATPSTTPTLQRRGARRSDKSPIKGGASQNLDTAGYMMSGGLPNRSPGSRQLSGRTYARGPRALSTIPSVDTLQSRPRRRPLPTRSEFSEDQTTIPEGSVLSRASDGDSPRRQGSGLKRRLTKHDDLMSVLSLARDDSVPLVSRRSTRARNPPAEPTTIEEVMNELSADELKYQRELRTLVEGVIPVLLQSAVSEPEVSTASRVFSRPMNGPAATKPIVDMGVSLERLKSVHKRIPMHDPNDLLSWAEGASRVYVEYLRHWRLGFKHVVVNLLPAQETEKKSDSPSWDHDLPRNKDGDLVGGDGQRVDVAYLLKRPLVRLKYLAKTFKSVNQMQPNVEAAQIAATYQDLVQAAKNRVTDENARLEDEAAANIDPTRARDPRSLAPITGVRIDATRFVKARDYFDMDLNHSSGQQLGCKIEIIYREDAPERGKAGDILFCEISTSGRWLLFPPMPLNLVSARKADRSHELVVMIRGYLANAREWREVMLLRADNDHSSSEWLQMLGSSPMPPRLSKRSSFNMLKNFNTPGNDAPKLSPRTQDATEKSREPSPREIEVPIGERVKSSSRIWDASEVNSVLDVAASTGERKERPSRYRNGPSSSSYRDPAPHSLSDNESQPRYPHDQTRGDRDGAKRPYTAHSRSKSDWTASTDPNTAKDYNVWLPSSEKMSDDSGSEEDDKVPKRPSMRRRTSSVPSLDMPNIPKLRKPGHRGDDSQRFNETTESSILSQSTDYSESEVRTDEPRSKPHAQQNRAQPSANSTTRDKATRTPGHTGIGSFGPRTGALPSFTPAFLKKHRRSSSPLKHEYEPSTASDSLSDSDISSINDGNSSISESSAEEIAAEGVSTVGDLRAFEKYTRRPFSQPLQTQTTHTPTSPSFSLPSASLAPSESASQSPYRTVPQTDVEPAKTTASIFCWSERGTWESLHPEQCIVYVTPGLIEAFDITQAQSVSLNAAGDEARTPTSKGVKPLVALELTPLVPLRRGTALDISIRSPPSANSLIRTGTNVMFRSHTPEDCERLYALLNRARIDNPTYIALQHARGPVQQSNWGEVMDRRNAARSASTPWWHLGSRKSSTYRSKGSRTLSIAATESSVGTMNSAFSALRLFSSSNRFFNIGKSTITSRDGTRSSNSESLSSGVATPLALDPRLGTPLGITNAKIRLFLREGTKWRDLGAARLTVMMPPRQDPIVAANPNTKGLQKRILIYGKTEGETLLDALLGESCFERVARTGIAVSVWEETVGPNGETGRVGPKGGVLNTRMRRYMVQMKSERDAAYTFGLVGKLRY